MSLPDDLLPAGRRVGAIPVLMITPSPRASWRSRMPTAFAHPEGLAHTRRLGIR